MAEQQRSVARGVVTAGLALQFVLTTLQILQSYPAEVWIQRLGNVEGEPVLGTVVLVLLLALLRPAWRGRIWALLVATVLQLLLTYEMLPWLLRKFTRPEDLVQWTLNLSYCVVGATAAAFGVVALLEEVGRSRPAPWSTRGAPSRQAWLVLLVLAGFAGAAATGAGMSRRPLALGHVPGLPDETLVVATERMAFAPMRLELPAGKRVALVLINRATDEHSFDLDEQNVHVRVPAGSSALAMIQVPASGELFFRCAVPGHTEAGMTGVIVAR